MTDEVPLLKNWLKGLPEDYRIKRIRVPKEKVIQIRKELKSMKTLKQVAIDCGVNYMTVYNILKRRTFKEDESQ